MTTRITSENITDATITSTDLAAGAGSTDWQAVIVADGSTVTTMVSGRGYFVNTTSAVGIVKLPASASRGDYVEIKDYAGTFGTNNLTIQRNGHNIQGVANEGLITTNRASLTLVYIDATKGWLYTNESNVGDLQNKEFVAATGGTVTTSGNFKIHTFTGDSNFVVSDAGNPAGNDKLEYLVVAGGGAGGTENNSSTSAGGGGAGGLRFASPSLAPVSYPAKPLAGSTLTAAAQTYPVTVGGGAAAPTSCCSSNNGSNSVFSTITSAGGGAGGSGAAPSPGGLRSGRTGGSGGGGSHANAGSAGNTPPVSPAQGTAGGSSGPIYLAGGGGGTSAAGANGAPNVAGAGGDGVGFPTAFGSNGVPCGSFRYYAGGGGGGGVSSRPESGPAGAGGKGGGAAGGAGNSDAPADATANTGGGGGGAGARYPAGGRNTGSAGGKGIVVIRYQFQD